MVGHSIFCYLSMIPRNPSPFLFSRSGFCSITNNGILGNYWNIILKSRNSKTNLERSLSQVKGKLESSFIENILHKCTHDRLLGLRFFIWAGQHSNYRHSSVMYVKACELLEIPQKPQALIDVLDDYRREGSIVSVKTFKVMLTICKEAKLPEQALSLLKMMGEFNCRPDTTSFNVVIRLFSEVDNMDIAKSLLQEMSLLGLYPDLITCVAMIKGFCNVGRLDEARKVFRELGNYGCSANIVAYSALIDGVCKAGSVEMALELLSVMEKENCSPNVVTYTSLIQNLCENGRAKEALGILDRMIENGCSPNRVTVSILLKGLSIEGSLDDAYKLVDKMVQSGSISSSQCYSSLLVCLVRTRNMEEAEKLMKRMLAMGVKPDGLACSSLIRELCLMGRSLDGIGWYHEMEKACFSMDSDVYSVLLSGLCEQGHLVEAATVISVMVGRGIRPKAHFLDLIVKQLKKAGKDELAMHLVSIGGC